MIFITKIPIAKGIFAYVHSCGYGIWVIGSIATYHLQSEYEESIDEYCKEEENCKIREEYTNCS